MLPTVEPMDRARMLPATAAAQKESSSPRILPQSAPSRGTIIAYAISGLSLLVTRSDSDPCFFWLNCDRTATCNRATSTVQMGALCQRCEDFITRASRDAVRQPYHSSLAVAHCKLTVATWDVL